MLQSRLTRVALAAAALILVSACAGVDGTERGAIRENVIEPGITAIQQADQLACSGNAASLRAAMEAYEILEGSPAASEDVLIAGQYLREGSELWDIVDGQLVPVDPDCGAVAIDPPDTIEIITSTEPPRTADELFAEYTAGDIAAMGGEDCARQLAAIFAGVDRFLAEQGRQPDDLDELRTTGYLDESVTLWEVTDEALVPTEGSGCLDIAAN